jgi:hypothetical protein
VSEGTSTAVLAWWAFLSTVSVFNIVLWARLARRRAGMTAEERRLLWLAACFVFGCAFRSFLPRADVQRICLVDSWFSTVLVGRAVATVAELAFVAQVAITLRAVARHADARFAVAYSHAIVPLIVVAELASWYAVVTTNFIGNAIEQSIWTATHFGVGVCYLAMLPRLRGALRTLAIVAVVLAAAFVAFMTNVDVPMYLHRHADDTDAGRVYFGLADGFRDLATRWVVTFRWSDWHEELAWMAGYFSACVWMSLFMTRIPALVARAARAQRVA